MSTATLVLVPLCAAVLIFAVVAFARLARAWKPDVSGEVVAEEDRAKVALEDQKARIFMTLRDLEHEFAAGKLSEADFRQLKARFEQDAVDVLHALERHR